MARSGFSFDERALRKAVAPGLARKAREVTAALNGLIPAYEGKPLGEVEAAVQSTWGKEMDGTLPAAEVKAFAEAIQRGDRVTVALG